MTKNNWHYDKKNVIELAEFLVDTEEITATRDLLNYFKDPSKYTNIWKLYYEEITGQSYKDSYTPSIFEALEK